MSRPLESQLRSSVVDLDRLWSSVHKTRSTSKTVTVDRDALARVLVDHSLMASGLWGSKLHAAAIGHVRQDMKA